MESLIIYNYLGIKISLCSNENNLIYVHAIYDKSVVKIEFIINNGEIINIKYTKLEGDFLALKLRQLKKFVSVYKLKIIWRWEQYFIWKININEQIIDVEKISKEDSFI